MQLFDLNLATKSRFSFVSDKSPIRQQLTEIQVTELLDISPEILQP